MIITNWVAVALGVFILLIVGSCAGSVITGITHSAQCADCMNEQAEDNLKLRREVIEAKMRVGM